MYSAAPKGESALWSRNTVKALFPRNPLAEMAKVSKPTASVVNDTLMSTSDFGMHFASCLEDGVRCKLTEAAAVTDGGVAGRAADGAARLAAVAVASPVARAPMRRPVVNRVGRTGMRDFLPLRSPAT